MMQPHRPRGAALVAQYAGLSRGQSARPHQSRPRSWGCSSKAAKVKAMRCNSRKILRHAGAVMMALALCITIPMTTLAQVVKLAQADAQGSRQSASPDSQAQAVHRVGVNESQPLALTLFDAVKMALGNNRELEVERINVQQSEYDLFAARGARDVSVGASSYYEHRTIPVGSLLQGGANGTLTTKTLNYDFTAQQ